MALRFIEIIKIFILILISSFLIFYQFNQIPKNLAFDEVEFAKLALSLDGKPYIPYSPQATGHSTLYFYILLFSFKIFGINNFALRFPAALFGVLSGLIFYFMLQQFNNITIKQLKNKKLSHYQSLITNNLPFLMTLVLITSRWYFNFARFAFEATFLLFLELTSIYFLLQYFKTPKSLSLIASGLFAGLAFNSYTPGRIFFLLPLSFLTLQLFNFKTFKQSRDKVIKQLFIFLIPFLITITPLSMYLMKHKDIRIEQQFFLKNDELSIQEKAQFLWQNIASTALMFHFKGDINGRHNYPGKPALNPILGALFLVGLIISIKNYKNWINLFFIFYFFLSILPTLMTYPWENPHMLRTFTVLPSICFFSIIGFSQLIDFILKKTKKFKSTFCLLFFVFLLLSFFYEIRTYFKYQAKVFETAFETNKKLEEIINKNL